MKAFLSYSLNDADQFVVPLTARRLQDRGFFVTNGYYKPTDHIGYQTLNQINTSQLFIGIITNSGQSNQRVYNEWVHAIENKTPAILLVEDRYQLNNELKNHPNIIRFNRYRPQNAINKIKFKMDKSKDFNTQLEEAAPWILGGIAIIALIELLSKD